MKPKNFEKKLTFNKETIANLDISKMKDVKGGVIPYGSALQTNCLTSPCGTCGTCGKSCIIDSACMGITLN